MQKTFLLISAFAGLIFLAGCNAPVPFAIAEAGGIYGTKPGDLPPADTADQIAPHDSWCYKTLGDVVECYPAPQDTPPGRLLNVDPASKYPLTTKAYAEALAQSQKADAAKTVAKDTVAEDTPNMPSAVQPAPMTPIPTAKPSVTPAQQSAMQHGATQHSAATKNATKRAKHKKHKKKSANSCLCTGKDEPTPPPPIAP